MSSLLSGCSFREYSPFSCSFFETVVTTNNNQDVASFLSHRAYRVNGSNLLAITNDCRDKNANRSDMNVSPAKEEEENKGKQRELKPLQYHFGSFGKNGPNPSEFAMCVLLQTDEYESESESERRRENIISFSLSLSVKREDNCFVESKRVLVEEECRFRKHGKIGKRDCNQFQKVDLCDQKSDGTKQSVRNEKWRSIDMLNVMSAHSNDISLRFRAMTPFRLEIPWFWHECEKEERRENHGVCVCFSGVFRVRHFWKKGCWWVSSWSIDFLDCSRLMIWKRIDIPIVNLVKSVLDRTKCPKIEESSMTFALSLVLFLNLCPEFPPLFWWFDMIRCVVLCSVETRSTNEHPTLHGFQNRRSEESEIGNQQTKSRNGPFDISSEQKWGPFLSQRELLKSVFWSRWSRWFHIIDIVLRDPNTHLVLAFVTFFHFSSFRCCSMIAFCEVMMPWFFARRSASMCSQWSHWTIATRKKMFGMELEEEEEEKERRKRTTGNEVNCFLKISTREDAKRTISDAQKIPARRARGSFGVRTDANAWWNRIRVHRQWKKAEKDVWNRIVRRESQERSQSLEIFWERGP